MAASVRIEDEAFADERYEDLAHFAGLRDADHARGKMARLWRQCTIEGTETIENHLVIRLLGEGGIDALVKSRLGEKISETHVRIRGTKGRIEWLGRLRENGNKGGRPKGYDNKPKGYGGGKPSGSPNRNPPAPAPAPANISSQVDVDLTERLVHWIVRNNPKHKISTLSVTQRSELVAKWADRIRLMREIDKRDPFGASSTGRRSPRSGAAISCLPRSCAPSGTSW
jgi:hypothetical protein